MKKKTLKIISIIIAAILLIACMTMVSQAAGATPDEENTFLDGVALVADGLVGILLLPLKIFIIIIGTVIRAIAGGIALIGGTNGLGNTLDTIMLSPEDIIFNKVNLTSVDVFDFSVSGAMLTIRQNIAMWYYALRNLSIVILLIILVYVGLRMALSTVAEEEAKYKKMLKDWLVSFILVFLLHYIIIFTIWVNNGLVDIFAKSLSSTSQFGNAINDVLLKAVDIRLSVGMGSAIVYVMLCILTLIFLAMYIKRMLTVSFLILIAPIITITYSIDKMGDGKSQALNTWLKEFVYNILIQPFHCLIYLIFGTTAVSLMNGSLSSSILAIIMIMFILQAEKIIKQIFGFKASSLGEGLASAAALGAGIKLASNSLAKGGAKSSGAVGSGSGSSSSGSSGGGNGGTPSKPANINNTAAGYASSSDGSSGSSSTPSPYTPPTSSGSKAAQVGSLLASKGKKVGKATLSKLKPSSQFRMAARMTGAAFGAVTGDLNTALAMGTAGGAVGTRVTNAASNASIQKRVKQNERYFANAYSDYAQDTGMDEDELREKTQAILDMDMKDIADQDKAYASFVYAMRDTYSDAGENDPRRKVLDTIHEIHSGNIQPKQPKK